MTNREIRAIAVRQSAVDSNCRPEDFACTEHKVVLSVKHANAARYLEPPFLCSFTSYGSNVVASVCAELAPVARSYLGRVSAAHCFEPPNLHILSGMLRPKGLDVCNMAEYFLPDLDLLKPLPCALELRVLEREVFFGLYLPQWGNALCEKRRDLDVLAVGAYECGTLVGLAGCSADCEDMWQIGVDVLPAYRRRGIASALTSRLAWETLQRGKVPFYCAAWCNLASVRNAIRSGFRPAWVQMTVRRIDEIAACNGV